MKFHTLFSFFCLAILFSGCETYYLSTTSLTGQLNNSSTLSSKVKDSGNELSTIKVKDKNGNDATLNVTYHTSVRITDIEGKSRIVYLKSMSIRDSMLNASKSNFINIPIKPIPLKNISKIELQE